MRGTWHWFMLAVSVCMAVCAVWMAWHLARGGAEGSRDQSVSCAFYLWQRRWSPEMREAARRAAPYARSFMVLSGEIDARRRDLVATHVHPAWEILAETRTPVTLVFRADVSLAARLEDSAARAAAANYLACLAKRKLEEASAAGVNVAGIQLDYDCPTAGLSRYAQLLGELELDRNRTALSITVLPTWLGSDAFRELVAGLDYYVLQVHSLERPSTIDDGTVLCRTERIPGYLALANAYPTPFYLALPTYGYELAYDRSGRFLGLAAEGPRPDWAAGTRIRAVSADPADLARVVRDTQTAPPEHLCGIVWFRLPVEGDRLNWPWPTLLPVMGGRVPEVSLAAEIRRPEDGLFEVWIRNIGECTPAGPVEVHIGCDRARIQARDLLNGFAETGVSAAELRLHGPVPPPGGEILAGWYRCQGDGLTHCAAQLRQEDPS